MKKYCIYLRVSTQKQGRSGLGLEAQRKMCCDFITQHGGEIDKEFVDVESGTHRTRKGLANALTYCKQHESALVIAKLDRLARDVEFCFRVVNTGVDIHFCDMPVVNSLLLGVFAAVAQYERELTSDRTRKALAAKRERGEDLGGACEKWQESNRNKDKQLKEQEYMQRGKTKNLRYMESRDVQAFLEVLRNVFPQACKGEPYEWDWSAINAKQENRAAILSLMRSYKGLDADIFRKWNLNVDDLLERSLHVKLAAYIQTVRSSAKQMGKNVSAHVA